VRLKADEMASLIESTAQKRKNMRGIKEEAVQAIVCGGSPGQGLPPQTIAWTVSSELLGFVLFYFFSIFLRFGRKRTKYFIDLLTFTVTRLYLGKFHK